ncbi:TPA: L-2-amino-thiazoline-4-carboxylic acid hydrolase [Clostridium botulinum]|nr:L-2-amino-thiazoline-4-carboxylic acid hydrolase [Clostridium botulinum]MBY6771938.1 L-2-amino-thiazoline-4-carboxylic acid hydrolase [Clostridium botulinum]MBY6781157.1 L-2-amino-thiazoline-4-carboxylic acid hydrolase [Clostridium botulinum]MBY6787705.1 L-2-amino-thiazoline-4-carboxylic acid hydrolase [Clostridium botulinum]MBY6864151.1 L-2-amino-thiazoline-4-carboxylic acid hydrolase [Clostridium botulinum]MBY6885987.1 L-2-amino-thiazoline-4-carboxylic acid hydrolase [Clostridium botulinu
MNNIVIKMNKKYFVKKYGIDFYAKFKVEVGKKLDEIIPEVPDIGDSIFKLSYLMAIFFIAWYKVLEEMKISNEEIRLIIWAATENCLKKIPNLFIPVVKKIYLNPMIRKAESHTKKSEENNLPEYDWKIKYEKVDDNCFYLNTYECGIKKLCKKFDVEDMLLIMCRMDYLTSHYLKSGFERTKTLGDGDEVCNNKFFINGECEWSPEKGFAERK